MIGWVSAKDADLSSLGVGIDLPGVLSHIAKNEEFERELAAASERVEAVRLRTNFLFGRCRRSLGALSVITIKPPISTKSLSRSLAHLPNSLARPLTYLLTHPILLLSS